jgi:hypothetical protein
MQLGCASGAAYVASAHACTTASIITQGAGSLATGVHCPGPASQSQFQMLGWIA